MATGGRNDRLIARHSDHHADAHVDQCRMPYRHSPTPTLGVRSDAQG
jgi:hypothetical protein